jgi:hypothetical protein
LRVWARVVDYELKWLPDNVRDRIYDHHLDLHKGIKVIGSIATGDHTFVSDFSFQDVEFEEQHIHPPFKHPWYMQRICAGDEFVNELAQSFYRTRVFSIRRANDFHHFLHVGVLGLGIRPARYLKRIVLELDPTTRHTQDMMSLLLGLLSHDVASNLQVLFILHGEGTRAALTQ